jgi:hypothetical protein
VGRAPAGRAAGRSRAVGAGDGYGARQCGRTGVRRQRVADVPPRCHARRCPVSGCGGGGQSALPPSTQICASSASSAAGPRASAPSVLGWHRGREALAPLLAPAAQYRPTPAGTHPRPESVLILPPPIPSCPQNPSLAGGKASRTRRLGSRLTFPHPSGTISCPVEPPTESPANRRWN